MTNRSFAPLEASSARWGTGATPEFTSQRTSLCDPLLPPNGHHHTSGRADHFCALGLPGERRDSGSLSPRTVQSGQGHLRFPCHLPTSADATFAVFDVPNIPAHTNAPRLPNKINACGLRSAISAPACPQKDQENFWTTYVHPGEDSVLNAISQLQPAALPV
jgi:hypothetical protein